MPDQPQPTNQDRENERRRLAIAQRQNDEYMRVLRWAIGKFGPGYLPTGRHYLLDKEEEDRSRREGTPAVAAATVYTVRHEETGRRRHFVVDDGKVREVGDYHEAFGPMLKEPHPTMRIEVKGRQVPPHRYSLCWAAIETYTPRSAEALAKTRATRERNKAAREEQTWRDAAPLFTTWAERNAQEEEKDPGHSGP
jgi:hypothetical protein